MRHCQWCLELCLLGHHCDNLYCYRKYHHERRQRQLLCQRYSFWNNPGHGFHGFACCNAAAIVGGCISSWSRHDTLLKLLSSYLLTDEYAISKIIIAMDFAYMIEI
jgi:hypothetical protein